MASNGIEVTDNRYNYDNKKLSELCAADDDHPLNKEKDIAFANLTVGDRRTKLVDW
jgi:hypothetical protein